MGEKPEQGGMQNKGCRIFVIAFGIILLFGVVVWFGYDLYRLYYPKGESATSNQNSKAPTASSSGNWTLTMTDKVTDVGPETSLAGDGSGEASFQISSGKFTASGPWSGQMDGTVGASNDTSTIRGQMNLTGQVNGDKLNFTITYTEEECSATVETPIGGVNNNQCSPGQTPDPHQITIDLKDGATISNNFQKTTNGYAFSWTEYWKLTSAK